MSAGGISDPYAIATLPKPFDNDHGNFHSAPVHSTTQSGKRKRSEIAIGIDGEAVNIYDIQQQNAISSYPLPSQSFLVAPPCSMYCKGNKAGPSRRQTYVAIRDGLSQKRLRLMSFTEDLGRRQGQQADSRSPVRRERKLKRADILAIEAVPITEKGKTHDGIRAVLVHYQNGDVDCVSEDLSGNLWEYRNDQPEVDHVEYAAVCDLETARKGLLRGREDVLALLDPSFGEDSSTASLLLCQVVHQKTRLRLRVLTLNGFGPTSLKTSSLALQEVMSYDLPSIKGAKKASYELHVASGYLYQHAGHVLTLLDLSGMVPKVSFKLGQKLRVRAFAHVSAASVLVISDSGIAIFETTFGSSLCSSSVSFQTIGSSQHDDSSSKLLPTNLIYCSESGLLAARLGRDIICFQLSEELSRRRMAHRTLLADVTTQFQGQLNGMSTEMMGPKMKDLEKWEKWRSRVDLLAQQSDVAGLEHLIAGDLHLHTQHRKGAEVTSAVTGSNIGSDYDLWDITARTYEAQQLDSRKSVYLLGKIFVWRRSRKADMAIGERLAIALKSYNIIRWLALAGYLTPRFVQLAVTPAIGEPGMRHQVQPGAIMGAIQDADPSFQLTCELISLPIDWHITEITCGLSRLIRSLKISHEDDAEPSMMDAFENGDTTMADGEDDLSIEAQATAVAEELDYATRLIDNGVGIRSEALRLLMIRLEQFSKDDIVQALRTLFSSEDMDFLIKILRIELHDGGWTSRHIEQAPDEMDIENPSDFDDAEPFSSSEQALRTISKLLNCCIDAVGVSGWLVGRSGDNNAADELIESIRAEVSAALEGCLEAETVGKCLDELVRLSGSEEVQRKGLLRKDDHGFAEAFMPLGSRLNPPEVKTLFSRAGRRKKLAPGAEHNRAIGKYTFEQIRF